MTHTAGIPLVDLFDLTDRINAALPQSVEDFIDQFAAVDHGETRSNGAIFHHGSLRAIADSLDEIPTEFNIGIGKLSLPLLQIGIPFQLAFPRQAFASNLVPDDPADKLGAVQLLNAVGGLQRVKSNVNPAAADTTSTTNRGIWNSDGRPGGVSDWFLFFAGLSGDASSTVNNAIR